MILTRPRLLLALLMLVPALPLHAQDAPPDPFQAHVRAGEAAARSGLPLQAAREFGAAAALHPNDAAAHYALAGVLEQAGRPTQALAEYQKTVRLDPSDAAAHNDLAMLLEDQGRTAEALAQYRQAVALSPKDARLHFNLASALEAAGQRAAARAEYGEAQRLDPALGVPTRLASSPPSPLRGEGVRPVKTAGPAGPSPLNPTPSPRSGEGGELARRVGTPAPALLAAGRLPEAEAAFRALLARTPGDPEARLRLGIVLYAQGHATQARREWTRVLSGRDPDAARRARRLLNAYP